MPFRADIDWPRPRGRAVLVFITDPAGVTAPPPRQMMKLYGLTGAEAALAADLLVGLEPREIAERRGRSLNTVRTQLAGLMAKTNVNRQTDLVRLLARMPSDRDWR